MAGSHYEKILAAEWLAIMGIETADALGNSSSGKLTLPSPSRYFATMLVFFALAAAAMFGDKAGKLAAAFGGVAMIGMSLAPSKPGGTPVVLSAINYFTEMINNPPSSSIASSNAAIASSKVGEGALVNQPPAPTG